MKMIEKIKEALYEQMNTNRHINHDDIINVGLEQALSIINQIAEEYVDGWIPCSLRLPEKSGIYIVTGIWRGESREIWMCEFMILGAFGAGWSNDARKPIVDAWMPLPEPYKGE